MYRGGGDARNTQITWLDRQGKSLSTVVDPGDFRRLALSPDGTRMAVDRIVGQNMDIWLTEFARGGLTRFTFDPASDYAPIWAPDMRRIVFSSSRSGANDLYEKAASMAGDDQLVLKSDRNKTATDWSPDGRFLMYQAFDPQFKADLWILPMDGPAAERKPAAFLRTQFNERYGRFSPDNRWVAYESDESGKYDIYVRPFDPTGGGAGGKWMVSQGGGTQPRWRKDGKELFYLAPDGNVMSASVSATGSAFQPGIPKALFKGPANPQGWDVTADGSRFLFPVPVGAAGQAPFTVVLNWTSLLKK